MGIDNEPAATFGHEDQRFPTLLNPEKTLKIHPFAIDALERNATKPDDEDAERVSAGELPRGRYGSLSTSGKKPVPTTAKYGSHADGVFPA